MPSAIPIDQQNALPISTIDQAAGQGVVTMTGGVMTKTFDPVATGVNGVFSNAADPHTISIGYIITKWLDLSGCEVITCNLGVIQADPGGHIDEQINLGIKPIGACVVNNVLIDPVPFPPGPDPRNLTGNYATSAFPAVATLAIPIAGANQANQFPFKKCATASFKVGSIANFGRNGIAIVKFLLNQSPGSTFQQNYLTVIGVG